MQTDTGRACVIACGSRSDYYYKKACGPMQTDTERDCVIAYVSRSYYNYYYKGACGLMQTATERACVIAYVSRSVVVVVVVVLVIVIVVVVLDFRMESSIVHPVRDVPVVPFHGSLLCCNWQLGQGSALELT